MSGLRKYFLLSVFVASSVFIFYTYASFSSLFSITIAHAEVGSGGNGGSGDGEDADAGGAGVGSAGGGNSGSAGSGNEGIAGGSTEPVFETSNLYFGYTVSTSCGGNGTSNAALTYQYQTCDAGGSCSQATPFGNQYDILTGNLNLGGLNNGIPII